MLTRKSETSDMVWFVDHENNGIDLEPCEMNPHHSRLAIQKLAEYEIEEKQGLLLKPPCKVGDTVYFVAREVLQCEVFSIEFGRFKNLILIKYSGENDLLEHWGTRVSFDDIGKIVFFTKEEAEQVLNGGK